MSVPTWLYMSAPPRNLAIVLVLLSLLLSTPQHAAETSIDLRSRHTHAPLKDQYTTSFRNPNVVRMDYKPFKGSASCQGQGCEHRVSKLGISANRRLSRRSSTSDVRRRSSSWTSRRSSSAFLSVIEPDGPHIWGYGRIWYIVVI